MLCDDKNWKNIYWSHIRCVDSGGNLKVCAIVEKSDDSSFVASPLTTEKHQFWSESQKEMFRSQLWQKLDHLNECIPHLIPKLHENQRGNGWFSSTLPIPRLHALSLTIMMVDQILDDFTSTQAVIFSFDNNSDIMDANDHLHISCCTKYFNQSVYYRLQIVAIMW